MLNSSLAQAKRYSLGDCPSGDGSALGMGLFGSDMARIHSSSLAVAGEGGEPDGGKSGLQPWASFSKELPPPVPEGPPLAMGSSASSFSSSPLKTPLPLPLTFWRLAEMMSSPSPFDSFS